MLLTPLLSASPLAVPPLAHNVKKLIIDYNSNNSSNNNNNHHHHNNNNNSNNNNNINSNWPDTNQVTKDYHILPIIHNWSEKPPDTGVWNDVISKYELINLDSNNRRNNKNKINRTRNKDSRKVLSVIKKRSPSPSSSPSPPSPQTSSSSPALPLSAFALSRIQNKWRQEQQMHQQFDDNNLNRFKQALSQQEEKQSTVIIDNYNRTKAINSSKLKNLNSDSDYNFDQTIYNYRNSINNNHNNSVKLLNKNINNINQYKINSNLSDQISFTNNYQNINNNNNNRSTTTAATTTKATNVTKYSLYPKIICKLDSKRNCLFHPNDPQNNNYSFVNENIIKNNRAIDKDSFYKSYGFILILVGVVVVFCLGLYYLRATRGASRALNLPIPSLPEDRTPLNSEPDNPVPMLSVQSPGCAGMERLGVPARSSLGSQSVRDDRGRRVRVDSSTFPTHHDLRMSDGNKHSSDRHERQKAGITKNTGTGINSHNHNKNNNQYNNHYNKNSNSNNSISCPHHVALPDGEWGPDRDLQTRTPCPQSEVPRTYVKPPPNKTVRDVPRQPYLFTSPGGSINGISNSHYGGSGSNSLLSCSTNTLSNCSTATMSSLLSNQTKLLNSELSTSSTLAGSMISATNTNVGATGLTKNDKNNKTANPFSKLFHKFSSNNNNNNSSSNTNKSNETSSSSSTTTLTTQHNPNNLIKNNSNNINLNTTNINHLNSLQSISSSSTTTNHCNQIHSAVTQSNQLYDSVAIDPAFAQTQSTTQPPPATTAALLSTDLNLVITSTTISLSPLTVLKSPPTVPTSSTIFSSSSPTYSSSPSSSSTTPVIATTTSSPTVIGPTSTTTIVATTNASTQQCNNPSWDSNTNYNM